MNLNEQDEQNKLVDKVDGSATENKEAETKKAKVSKKPLDKKSLIRIISISAAAAVAAVALTLGLVLGLGGKSSREYTVTFEPRDHVSYDCELLDEAAGGSFKVKSGTTVKFSVEVEDGYTQNPRVTANGSILSAEESVYSVVVNEDKTIEVSAVSEVSVSLEGSGTSSSPYLITSARDINYMASMVNGGNSRYVQAYYRLENDIDCEGQELDVIGDGRNGSAFFGGYFDGADYTISNYRMNTVGVEFVGLFGYVQSSGNGDELGTITNLNLKDFTINAYPTSTGNVCVGSFIGYGFAANLLVSSATNGNINVFGNNYFCYAGGAIGIQQSASITSGGSMYPFYSAVNYVSTDVNIYRATGFVYAAGGITGYLYSVNEMSTALIANCYSNGNVFGAIRVGGIAGMMSEYSSIANCYSTGELEAVSDLRTTDEEVDALAGGIAGYAGANSIISDCFSTATTNAISNNNSTVKGGILARAAGVSANEYVAMVYNCYADSAADGTSASFITNTLKWSSVDWVITNGSLPTINFDTTEELAFNVSYDFSDKTVDGVKTYVETVSVTQNYYAPLCDYFRYSQGGLSEVFVSEDEFTSFGYFFDAELKQRVPYGYVMSKDVTFYIGFADYSEVAGTYYLDRNGRMVSLTLEKDGSYTYVDGITYESAYAYDGETLYFYDAPFARLAILDREAEDPSLYFETFNFVGKKTNGTIKVYDGTYFTEENPLEIGSATPSTRDEFFGYWEKSATINNKVYYFDGNGLWSFGGENGSYTVTDGVANLGNGVTASIHSSGLLLIKEDNREEYYCYQGSLFGTWFDRESGNYLIFEGYGSSYAGDVVINVDGTSTALRYVKDDFFGEDCVTLLSGASLFGYLQLTDNNTLTGVLYSNAVGGFTQGHEFYLVDNYTGEWIGEGSIDGVDFSEIDFNGFGIYEVEVADGLISKLGTLTVYDKDGGSVQCEYKVSVDNALIGEFEYNGRTYTLSFDDVNGTVKIEHSGFDAVTLGRKDDLYNFTLIDSYGITFKFNGGGYLTRGGILTIIDTDGTEERLGYRIESGTVADKNLRVTLFNEEGTENEGTITIASNKFVFARTGETRKNLDFKTDFTGTWAVSGFMYNFTVGNFDLSYTSTGRFMDMVGDATYTYYPEGNYVHLSYMSSEATQPSAIYLILVENGNVAVSSYPYLVAGDYFYASISDEYMGTWNNSETNLPALQFDGLADSKYAYGIAYDSVKDMTYYYTRRFGKIYMWEYNNEDAVYVIDRSVNYGSVGENIYYSGRITFEIVKFDAAREPIIKTTAEDGTVYNLYFDGSVEVEGLYGTYELIDVDGNVTSLVIHLPGEDDVNALVDSTTGKIIFD